MINLEEYKRRLTNTISRPRENITLEKLYRTVNRIKNIKIHRSKENVENMQVDKQGGVLR